MLSFHIISKQNNEYILINSLLCQYYIIVSQLLLRIIQMIPSSQATDPAISAVHHLLSLRQREINRIIHTLRTYKNQVIKDITNSTRVQMAFIPQSLLDMPLETLFNRYDGDIDQAANHLESQLMQVHQRKEDQAIDLFVTNISPKEYKKVLKSLQPKVSNTQTPQPHQLSVQNSAKQADSRKENVIFNYTESFQQKIVNKHDPGQTLAASSRGCQKNRNIRAFQKLPISPVCTKLLDKGQKQKYLGKKNGKSVKQQLKQNREYNCQTDSVCRPLEILRIEHEELIGQNLGRYSELMERLKEDVEMNKEKKQELLQAFETISRVAEKYKKEEESNQINLTRGDGNQKQIRRIKTDR